VWVGDGGEEGCSVDLWTRESMRDDVKKDSVHVAGNQVPGLS